MANVLFTYELASRLDGTDVTVNSYEPGMTATDFGRYYTGFKGLMSKIWRPFMVTPEKAAETAIYLASSPKVAGVTGKHFAHKKEVRSSKMSFDVKVAQQLWEVSEAMVGISKHT